MVFVGMGENIGTLYGLWEETKDVVYDENALAGGGGPGGI